LLVKLYDPIMHCHVLEPLQAVTLQKALSMYVCVCVCVCVFSKLPEHLMDYVVHDSQLQESFIADASDSIVDAQLVESHTSPKKASSKHGKPKRQSDRKRKGPSWYSVRNASCV